MTTTTAPPETRSIADRAFDAVPGYREAKTLSYRLGQELQNQPRFDPLALEHDLKDRILTAIAAGEPLPDNIGEQVIAIRNGQEIAQARWALISVLKEHSKDGPTLAVAAAPDPALDVLRAELDEIVDRARQLDQVLGPVGDGDGAIRLGVADEWTAMIEVSTRYREVRVTQQRIVDAAIGDAHVARQLVERCGILADNIDHDPALRQQRDRLIGEDRDGFVAYGPPPWPSGDAAFLRWAIHNAQLWLPSIKAMNAMSAAMQAEIDEAAFNREPRRGDAPRKRTAKNNRLRIAAGEPAEPAGSSKPTGLRRDPRERRALEGAIAQRAAQADEDLARSLR